MGWFVGALAVATVGAYVAVELLGAAADVVIVLWTTRNRGR